MLAKLQAGSISALKIAVLIAVLIAFITWAKNNPDLFQNAMNAIGKAATSLLTWVCDWVVAKTDSNPST